MNKERELLVRIVEADMVEYMQLMGEAEELLAQPEQESFMFKDRELIGSLIAHDDMYKKGYERGFAIARKDYKQKVINAFGVDDE
jgi:hypothetical protein